MASPAPPSASVDQEQFAILVRRAGLPLDAQQRRTLFEVYGYIEAMAARLRTPRARGAEPAHVFVPGQGWERR